MHIIWYIIVCMTPMITQNMELKINTDSYILNDDTQAVKRLDLLNEEDNERSKSFICQLPIKKDFHILSVGAGIGTMELWMAKELIPLGIMHITDKSKKFLNIAQERAIQQDIHNVYFTHVDVHTLSTNPKYDLIYARYLLQHVPNATEALKKLCSALKTDGLLIIEDEDFYQTRLEPYHPIMPVITNVAQEIASLYKIDFGIGPKIANLIQQQPGMIIKKEINFESKSGKQGVLLLKDTIAETSEKLTKQNIQINHIPSILQTLNILINQDYSIITCNYQLCAKRVV
ncbi:MAG TPA: methyltransferase domain-containing protein [Candidatus Babeliales bacterium]|nr:methyltransferase domain-containing protein [Candidatus Babeliales bacterium]